MKIALVTPAGPGMRNGNRHTALRWAAFLQAAGHQVTVEVEWRRDAEGRLTPVEIAGTERTRPAQLALISMGFLGPEQSLLHDLGVDCDVRSNIRAEYDRYATSLKGVFAAGDCRRGQSLVVWAIAEGRGAARECDRYLMGRTDLP